MRPDWKGPRKRVAERSGAMEPEGGTLQSRSTMNIALQMDESFTRGCRPKKKKEKRKKKIV